MYGHNPSNCPDSVAQAHRKPRYLEQLLPPSVLIRYNIQTKTLLPNTKIPEIREEFIMEIPENEAAIRAALIAAGEKPMICQEKGRKEKKELIENKKRLQKVADIAGKKLVYVRDIFSDSHVPEVKATEAKRGGAKKNNNS